MENDKGLGPNSGNNDHSISVGSKVKKGVLDAGTSVWESLQYVKAFIVSQVKKLSAKDRKELMEADLQADRMKADAADSAEAEKKRHEQEVLGIQSL